MGFRTAVGCKACGRTIDQGVDPCPHCGRSQAAPIVVQAAAPTSPIASDQRRTILQQSIAYYSNYGYRVVSQTDTTAQLMLPKQFSAVVAILSFFLFGIGLLIYIFYYLSKRDSLLFVQVDDFGKVTAT